MRNAGNLQTKWCAKLTSSFVFICTPWQRSLWMALVTRAAGNREFTPITKASPQLPPIKIKMGGWTNSWKSKPFRSIFTNTREGFFWKAGIVLKILMPQEWIDEKEARQISCEKWILVAGKAADFNGKVEVKGTSKEIPGWMLLTICMLPKYDDDEYRQNADDNKEILRWQ